MEMELSKSNQQGFVLVLFLSLLPVIVIGLSGLAIVLLQIQAKSEARHVCREALYQTQKQVGQNLTLLMNLNPAAKALRAELLALEEALVAAGGPETPAGAAIAAEIIEVQLQKAALGSEQKALIAASEFLLRSGGLRSDLTVRSTLHRKQIRFAGLVKLSVRNIEGSLPHLAIRPDDPADTAPIYELEDSFTEKQSLQTSWRIVFSWNSQTWMQRNLHWREITIKDACRASLTEKSGRFQPVLNEDRF